LWSLQYLRKQALAYPNHKFIHAVPYHYLGQLIEIVSDLHNLTIIDDSYKPGTSLDTWVNANNYTERHPDQWDISRLIIDFFKEFSALIGLESHLRERSDLQFDYPGISRAGFIDRFDFMIINSRPISGQFPDYDAIETLIGEIVARGHTVVTTAPNNYGAPCTETSRLSVSGIGCLSRNCKYIIGVPTGPMWTTFNVLNSDTVELRLMFVTPFRVFISPNTSHAATVNEARKILQKYSLL
jgi:hypothetical protein